MNITVDLLHHTPLEILVGAIRQCYESQDKSDSGLEDVYCQFNDGLKIWKIGEKDKALIERIIKSGHHSCLEHISFNFQIKGISRLNLQELARHRMASLSVKSSRYTLVELKKEGSFEGHKLVNSINNWDVERASKYINLTGIEGIDLYALQALENLWELVNDGSYTNDQVKYVLPESYKLDLFWSINARSLRNFLELRTSSKAHFEIRELACKIYNQIPDDYKFLFCDCVS
jgi:thymidylate synthase (FAD)